MKTLLTKNIINYFTAIKNNDKEDWIVTRNKLSDNEIKYTINELIKIEKVENLFSITSEQLAQLADWNSEAKTFRENIWDGSVKVDNLLDAYEGYLSSTSRNYRLTNRFWTLVKDEVVGATASKLLLIEFEN